MTELIVRFNGDIYEAARSVGAEAEVLLAGYAILTIEEDRISELLSLPQIEYAELPRSLGLMAEAGQRASCINEVKSVNGYNLTGRGVIVAIIDSGIDYTHRAFRNSDGTTRILYIWDQTLQGTPPEGFIQGTEFDENEINGALFSDNPYSLGVTDFLNHGTHIASVAAGSSNSSYEGVASESSFIIVKLGERGRESFARTTEIMRAVKYVIDKAIELNMPICINLSYGTNDGSHSGNSIFETYLNDISNVHKCSIISASGNEGASSHHFSAEIENGESRECEFTVSGGSSSLFLTVWKSFNDEMSFEIKAPNGETTSRFFAYQGNFSVTVQHTRVDVVFVQPSPYNGLNSVFIELTGETDIASGIWNFIITGEDIIDGRINIWLPVTERAGLDTKFLSPDINTTLTIPSTAENVITVGGYNSATGAIGDFSGRGFTADLRVKPDIIAPAVGIIGAVTGNSYAPMTGTSFAAPFVTGSAALLMEWGIVNGNDPFLYGQRLKAFLQRGAKREAGVSYPNRSFGWGKLCLSESLRLLERYKGTAAYTVMQNGGINVSDEEAAYSDNYYDVVVAYDNNVQRLIDESEYIKTCKILENQFAVLYIQEDYLNTFFERLGRNSVGLEPFLLGPSESTALDAAGITEVQNQPFLSLRGNGVLIGVVDSGIDYRNPVFIYEDGTTKIEYLWDQSIRSQPPEDFCYGTEYSADDINRALNSENPLEIVPSTDETGHGTRLASLAAGRQTGDFIGAAPDARIIAVKLKDAKSNIRRDKFVSADVECYESSDLMMGIDYLVKKARELDMPISIIVGMGTNEGAHTGISFLERYMTIIGAGNGVCISCAAGNEADKQHHTFIQLSAENQIQEFEIRVDENEEGFPIHIWSYYVDKISVAVTSPLGETIERIYPSLNFNQEYILSLGNTRVSVRYFLPVFQTTDQLTLIKLSAPTPGIWKIRVYGDIILVGRVHAWLPLTGFIKERTVFLEPSSSTTATVPATAREICLVGAYNQRDGSLYAPSGRGPTRFDFIVPDFTAPGVMAEAYAGGRIAYITGTSAAAAVSAGAAALLLEWGIVRGNLRLMNSTTIVSYFIRGARRSSDIFFPNNQWGFGMLDLYKTFQSI